MPHQLHGAVSASVGAATIVPAKHTTSSAYTAAVRAAIHATVAAKPSVAAWSPPPPPAYPDEPPDTQCEALLALIATVNCFSLCAFALIVLVRYLSKERSYKEACIVTYVLVALNLLLQLADATLPMVLTSNCFADTWLPPFNTTLMTLNCVRPCMLGDLYAAYALYALGKTCVGACDMYLSTGFDTTAAGLV